MKAALFVSLVVLAVPYAAVAGESPTPAVSACKAEYEQVGADRFAAKYGAGDAGIRACVAAHGGTVTTTPAPVASGPDAECKAEYLRIGADAFVAKYGATEAFGVCVRAHAGTAVQPQPVAPSGPEAECKGEYVKLGADAFKAKYGADEGFGACVKAHGGTVAAPKPAAPSGPEAECRAEYAKLGADAFKAKYGAEAFGACVKTHAKPAGDKRPAEDVALTLAKTLCSARLKSAEKAGADEPTGKEHFAACVRAALPKAKALVARCKEASEGKRDAFKQCLAGAAKTARAR